MATKRGKKRIDEGWKEEQERRLSGRCRPWRARSALTASIVLLLLLSIRCLPPSLLLHESVARCPLTHSLTHSTPKGKCTPKAIGGREGGERK